MVNEKPTAGFVGMPSLRWRPKVMGQLEILSHPTIGTATPSRPHTAVERLELTKKVRLMILHACSDAVSQAWTPEQAQPAPLKLPQLPTAKSFMRSSRPRLRGTTSPVALQVDEAFYS